MDAHHRGFSPVVLVAVAVVAVLALSCGGGGPSSSTPVTTVPRPSPSTTPIGDVGDAFKDANCALGKGSPNAECRRESAALLPDMQKAMDQLIQQKPQIFDLTAEYEKGTRAYKVLDKEAYMNGIVANLRADGLCSERDGDDAQQQTIRVKDSAEFSEDYDVLLSTGHMRRGSGSYRQTCTPAAFPVDRPVDAPPIGSGCGRPYPPPISRFNCKVNLKNKQFYTLDSTPLVGPNTAYCASVGMPERAICPLRVPGSPDRVACENWRVGTAKDTGKPGPTWTKADGSYCTGPDSGCQHHPSNPYELLAYKGGSYTVVGQTGSSCTVNTLNY
jgi:hypothetical protein